MADRTQKLLSDDELFSLVKQADPLAKRIPPGVRAIADAIYTAAIDESDELRADHSAALRLVSDIRFAIGDDGKRMQPELLEHATALRKDAERYAKLKPRLIAADFAYQDMDETVLVFSWPR